VPKNVARHRETARCARAAACESHGSAEPYADIGSLCEQAREVDRFGPANRNGDNRCARVQSQQSCSTAHGVEVPGDGALWEDRHDATVGQQAQRVAHAPRICGEGAQPPPECAQGARTKAVRAGRDVDRARQEMQQQNAIQIVAVIGCLSPSTQRRPLANTSKAATEGQVGS
jgi:hypothetical protein